MILNNIDFCELEPMRYWQPPASWTEEKKKTETRNRIFSGEWLGSEKKDGYFCKLIKTNEGETVLQSRSRGVNGEFPNKYEWVPHLNPLFEALPNGTCLLGELYLPNRTGSKNVTTILGCLKEKALARQENEKLYLYIFDILEWEGQSYLNKCAEDRFDEINSLARAYPFEYVEYAQYFDGNDLWELLGSVLGSGGEGIVMTRKRSIYQPGKRPSKDCHKVKKEIANTIDCVVIGANPPTKEYTGKNLPEWEYFVNTITNEKLPIGKHYREYYNGAPITPVSKNWYKNMAGSLRLGLVNGDKVIYFGDLGGLTYEVLENWEKYKGKVCEVSAMEITEDHKLRHPKFVCWREDKQPSECTISQVE
jgi:ATP-dependent DNA ligase